MKIWPQLALRQRLTWLFRRQSLRTKIIAWSFVPTAIILIIVAWASFNAYQQVTEKLVIERDRELTRVIAGELARELGRDVQLFNILAGLENRGDSIAQSLVFNQVTNIVKPRVGEGGYAYLVDARGHVIYHSDVTRLREDVSAQPVVGRVLNREIGALRTHDAEGREIVASFAPVPGTDWGLVTEESWGELIRSSQPYRQSLILLLTLGVVAPIFVVTIGVRHITRPITELTSAAQELAGGNFDQTITASTGDELEDLAEQFNRMAAQLQELYQNLERKVAERTNQLQVINQVGQRIASILSVEELLQEIVRLVQDRLGYYLVGIGLVEGDEIVIRAGAGRFWSTQDFRPVRLRVGRDGIVGQVAQSGEPLLALDTSQELDYFPVPEASETRSELAVPIKTKEAIIGVLDVQSERLDAFDEKDMAVLQSLAHQAAIAIENARLYQQAQQLAVMEERNRLARDLHDSVTQSLYGVTLFAEAAGRLVRSGSVDLAVEHLRELQQTAQKALREMRLLIFELRPSALGEDGLAAALQARLEAVEGRVGLETTLTVEGTDRRLAPKIEEGLYRIAQEALNNALKHAQAQQVKVYLGQNRSQVVLEIVDDGVGFDPSVACQRGGLGLRSIKERAAQLGAQLSLQSHLGAGTRVKVEL